MKRFFVGAAAALALACSWAQTYPSKTIRIVVPFTAGSATDIMARVVGEKLQAAWGQPVVVENRPGAGGTLGAEPMPMSPDQFDAYIKDEYTTLGAVMRSAPKQ